MRGTGNQIDLSGLPPEVLYALIEMLSRTMQPQESEGSFGSLPFQPGEMEALNRYGMMDQRSPRRVEPTSPGNVRDLLNRDYGWRGVIPRGNYGNP